MQRLRRLIPEIQFYAESILQTVHEALLILSSDLRVLWANESFYRIFQVGPGETEGQSIFDLGNRQWDIPELRILLWEVLPQGSEFHDHEVAYDFAGIGQRTMLLNAKKLHNESNTREMILLSIEDITERKRGEVEQFKLNLELKKTNDALRTLVLVDDLTGLYNRRGFLTFAEQHLKLARRIKQELLLVYLDLDGLKQINDTFGHQEGDWALIKTAEILRETFHRDLDIIARLGGDEFVVLTIDSSVEGAKTISNHLEEHLRRINTQTKCSYQLSFCLGMKRFKLNGKMTINDLMAEADENLYKNKRTRTNFEKRTLASEVKASPKTRRLNVN